MVAIKKRNAGRNVMHGRWDGVNDARRHGCDSPRDCFSGATNGFLLVSRASLATAEPKERMLIALLQQRLRSANSRGMEEARRKVSVWG